MFKLFPLIKFFPPNCTEIHWVVEFFNMVVVAASLILIIITFVIIAGSANITDKSRARSRAQNGLVFLVFGILGLIGGCFMWAFLIGISVALIMIAHIPDFLKGLVIALNLDKDPLE